MLQEAYEMAYYRFFRALDRVETILSGSRRGGQPVSMP
jgi:glutathionyl-hydroquinone reductase